LTWRLTREVGGVTAAHLAALFMACRSGRGNTRRSCGTRRHAAVRRGDLAGAVPVPAEEKFAAIFFIPLLLLAGAQLHMSNLSAHPPLIVCGWATRFETGLALVGGRHRGRAAVLWAVHPRRHAA